MITVLVDDVTAASVDSPLLPLCRRPRGVRKNLHTQKLFFKRDSIPQLGFRVFHLLLNWPIRSPRSWAF